MRYVAAVLALLVAQACPVVAADVPITGADKPVPAGEYAELTVKVEDGDQVTWRVYPPPVKKTTFPKEPGKLICIGKPGVEYQVGVTVVNFKKEKLDEGLVPLFFAGTPAPPPKPVPPGPTPGPAPPDPDGTSPFPDPGLKLLIVIPREGVELSQSQFDIIYGADAREFLDTAVGNANYRIYPVTTQVENAPKAWKDAFMRKRGPPPWLLVGNGKTGFEGELPKDMTLEQFKALVNKYK